MTGTRLVQHQKNSPPAINGRGGEPGLQARGGEMWVYPRGDRPKGGLSPRGKRGPEMVLAAPGGSRAAAVVAGQPRRGRSLRPHAEAFPTARWRERTRHRAAPRAASSVRLLPLVSHRARCRCDAISRLCSSGPRMPWRVSPCHHLVEIAPQSADFPSSVRIIGARSLVVRRGGARR
jgi:hypothetical protein